MDSSYEAEYDCYMNASRILVWFSWV